MPEDAHAEDTLAALTRSRRRISSRSWRTTTRPTSSASSSRRQERILQEVEDRAEVDQLLRYDEETAGGRMTTHMVTVRDRDHREQALEEIRRQARGGRGLLPGVRGGRRPPPGRHSAVQGPGRQPAGAAGARVHGAADVSVPPELDQEEVARLSPGTTCPAWRWWTRRAPARPDHLRRRDRRRRGGDHGGPPPVRRRARRRGAGGGLAGRGAKPAAVALRQPAHRVPRRRRGLPLPEHGAAHGGARRLDADHRGDGRQRGHPGARGHRPSARPGPHPEPPVRPRGREGSAGRDRQRARHRHRGRHRRGARSGDQSPAGPWSSSSP